ncbi:8503_t:CDS:2 [Paraglomus brasilianum]|uniref:Plasma membrane fusion protein PRM1 n=1 Tax=Paraglomus brasilianum TaxID=144538 RepID=A0A9N9GJC1_9GLOM|nr:8503_t:CDS:2 [Paraglomus brasilianum]
MPRRTLSPPPLASPGATSSGFALPQSPSLNQEEGFRMRSVGSPRLHSEKSSAGTQKPSVVSSTTTIHPYIGLRAKLSQAWLAYPIIALLFVVFRLLSAIKTIPTLVDEIKQNALRSCDALETATSTVTSLPHFMAGGFNRATVDGVNLSIKAIGNTLDLAILALEGIMIWIINVFKSTYRCLLELAIRGSLAAVADAVQSLSQFVSNNLGQIKASIDSQVNSLNDILNNVKQNSVVSTLNINIPTVSIPAADGLSNFQLPVIDQGIGQLNNSLPTMDEIESKLDDLVTIPFDQLRSIIKSSMSNVRFDGSVLPVPPKNQVTFCADNLDLSIVDNISRDLVKTAYIGLAVLVAVALLMIAANAVVIWYSHRRFMRHVDRTKKTISLVTFTHTRQTTIEIIKIAERPLITRWFIKASQFFKNPDHQHLFRWFWDYILHPGALVCLAIGLVGVLSIYLQLAILDGVRGSYQQPLSDAISTFGNAVLDKINGALTDTSKSYASESNSAISNIEDELNKELFGWVNTTTTAINNTLNAAVDDISTFINGTFGGVPIILTAVDQVINCLLFVKIRGIQAGLSFIQENASINLPRVNDSILLVDRSNMQEVVDKATTQIVGSPDSGSSGGEIGRLFDTYESSLKSELPLFWLLIACWFFLVLMGVGRVLWFLFVQKKKNENKVLQQPSSDSSSDEKTSSPSPTYPPPSKARSISLRRDTNKEDGTEIQRFSMLKHAASQVRKTDEKHFNSLRSKLNGLVKRQSTSTGPPKMTKRSQPSYPSSNNLLDSPQLSPQMTYGSDQYAAEWDEGADEGDQDYDSIYEYTQDYDNSLTRAPVASRQQSDPFFTPFD